MGDGRGWRRSASSYARAAVPTLSMAQSLPVQVALWLVLVTGVGRALFAEAAAQTQLDFLGTPAARRPRTSLDTLKGVVNAMVLSAGAPADAQAVQTFLVGGGAPAGPRTAAGRGHNSGHQSVEPDAAAFKVATKVETVPVADAAQKTKRAAPQPDSSADPTPTATAPAPGPRPSGLLGQVVQAVVNYSKSVVAAVRGNGTLPAAGVPEAVDGKSPTKMAEPAGAAAAEVEQVEMSTANATGHLHLPDDRHRQMTHEEARQVKQNAPGGQRAAEARRRRRARRRADKETAFKDAPFVTRRGGALGAATRAPADAEKSNADGSKKPQQAAAEQRQEDNKKNDAEVLPRAPVGAKRARGRRATAKKQSRAETKEQQQEESKKQVQAAAAAGTLLETQPQQAEVGRGDKSGRARRSVEQKNGDSKAVEQKGEAQTSRQQGKAGGEGQKTAAAADVKAAGVERKPVESGVATVSTREAETAHGQKSRRRRRAGHNSDKARIVSKHAKKPLQQAHKTAVQRRAGPRIARSLPAAVGRGLATGLTADASAVVVSPEVLKSVGADVFKVHHHRHSHPKAATKAAKKATPSGAGASAARRSSAPRTRRAIRELKPHEVPSRKAAQQPKGAGGGSGKTKGAHRPESVGGSVISIKNNPNVQTEVRTLKDGSQVVVKTGQVPPSTAPASAAPASTSAPTATAAPKKREVERVETQQQGAVATRPDDEIETLRPKPQHILVKSPGGATKKYDIPHIPQGVTVRGTATFVKALKVIDEKVKVRRRRSQAEKVDAVDGKLLPIAQDDNKKTPTADPVQSQKSPQQQAKGEQHQGDKRLQQQEKKKGQLQARTRRSAPTTATSPISSSTTETGVGSQRQQQQDDDQGSVKIYGTLEGEMVKVKGYIKGDLTGAASAYVVPTLLSRYGDFVQGARNGEFLSDQGAQGGQRGEVGFYGSAAQRSLNGLNQRAQYADSQAGQQGQRRDNGYYGNQQGVKSGHDIGRNFDTGQAFDKKGASGTYEDKNGNHRKGFKNAGFRNTYHKDESANSTSFFDDLNDEGGHKAFDQTGSSYLDQGANKNRGDFLNAAFVHDGAGKQGGFDGGTAYQDVRAQAGNAAHHDGFDDRAKLDYQHHGKNHGGTQTQGGKYYNGGGAFNQAEVAATGGKHGGGGGGGFHGAMQRSGSGGGAGFQGGFQNIASGGGDGGGGAVDIGGGSSFQTGSNSFQSGSPGFQSASVGFQGGSNGFQGGSAGFQGGSSGFRGGGGSGSAFQSNGGFLGGGQDGGDGGFQSRVITSAGLYDPSSAVRHSNPYPYYPPPSPVPLTGPAGRGQGVLDLRGGTFYQGGGYRSQFLPEPAPMAPLSPLAFAPSSSSSKAVTSPMMTSSSPTPSAYHRFSKSSFRIGGERDTGPNASPDAVRGKGFATWESFGNSAQATSLRYALIAMPELTRA